MAKTPRTDVTRLDLEGFERWLRGHLTSATFAFVLLTVMRVIRALFAENARLRASRAGKGKQPPSERSAALAKQLAFVFAVPANDVCASGAPAQSGAEPPAKESKKRKTAGSGRRPLAETAAHLPRHEQPNPVPEGRRTCTSCCVPMQPMKPRESGCVEFVPGHYVFWVRLDEVLAGTAATRLFVEGGWYATVRLPAILTEEEWVEALLERGVYVHPGAFFDFTESPLVVISLLTPEPDLEEGLAVLASTLAWALEEPVTHQKVT
jgi:hypothetical protein